MSPGVVIVGAGQAGGRAALLLREKAYPDPIRLIGEESEFPYERPPLSKGCLTGERALSDCYLADTLKYEQSGIEVELNSRVTDINLDMRTVVTSEARFHEFDKLVLATGGVNRGLNIPGSDLDGIFQLRNSADANKIASRLKPGARIMIVGGGFIGLEIAAAAIKKSCRVTLVELSAGLLSRVLPGSVSETIARIHQQKAVKLLLSEQVSSFFGNDAVESVKLYSGKNIDVDCVIVGIGLMPNVDLAERASLEIGNGIVCNALCQTSNPKVYAIGDCSCAYNNRLQTHQRLESWQNAEQQAEVAASHICGEEKPLKSVPWFWSDQYEYNLQIAGEFNSADDLIVRQQASKNEILAFSVRGESIKGAVSIAVGMKLAKELRMAQMIMENDKSVSREDLQNSDVSLKEILKA